MLTDEDEARMRAAARRAARDSLGYFNLRRDKSVVWSESGKAAHRLPGRVRRHAGQRRPARRPRGLARRDGRRSCARRRPHAWTPAVIGCSERAGQVWCRQTGFAALELGDEAVVDVRTLLPRGPGDAQRAPDGQADRAGRLHHRGLPGPRRVRRASAAAPSPTPRPGAPPRPSAGSRWPSAGSATPPTPTACWVVARQDGVMRAFLQFVPWGTDGMSLDLMRRDRTAEPGRQRAAHRRTRSPGPPRSGVTRVSLNFAAFRSALERGERLGAGPVVAGLAAGPALRLALVPDREPLPLQRQVPADAGCRGSWSTRTPPTCPRIAMAALEAEAFLTWPSLRWFDQGVAREHPGDGRGQRDPRLLQRRRRVVRAGRRGRARAASCSSRAPTCSTSAVSPPGPAPSARPRRRSCAGSLPVVAELSRLGARVSVDTMRAEVAARALEAGASVVNDVSGGLADPEMAAVVADSGAHVRRHALARAQHRTCSPWRRTTTWCRTCAAS